MYDERQGETAIRNIKLILCYRGTGYLGFQVQPGGITICEAVQDAIERIFGVRYDVKGCSRTDSGVHANRYCLNFRTDSDLPAWRIKRGLNAVLPGDIAVLEAEDAPEEFHARYSCKGKRYVYKIWNSEVRNPFLTGLTYHYFRPIDLERARQVCGVFVGTHDFAAFCGSKNTKEDTVRTIYACDMRRSGDLVEFFVEGDGFLYNMVRILVGTVLAVNENRLDVRDLPRMMELGVRRVECRTMPACGLYLDEVFYQDRSE